MTRPKLQVVEQSDEPQQETVDSQWESAARVKRQPVNWLVPGRILAGTVAVLEGHKGVGKSSLCCALVAAITRGKAFVGRKKMPKGAVLWSPGEEDAATVVRPRLEAAGADLDRVHFPAANELGVRRRMMLPGCCAYLRSAIDHYGATMCILDPLSSHVPPEMDLRSDQSIHQVLDPVADLAYSTGCTVVITRNLVKAQGVDRLHAGLGGAAVGGVARSVLVIDQPDRKLSRRVLRVVVCNLSPHGTPAIEYHLEDKGWPVVAKLREVPSDQDDEAADLLDASERDVRADARILLRRLLGNEWVSVSCIRSEADNASISERTLRSAKTELGVQSRRVGTSTPAHWEWGPPKGGW